jgi:putative transposase
VAEPAVRKTFKYKLSLAPGQERLLGRTLLLCRHVYNGALEQRKTWWERGQGKSANYYQQKAELPDLKATCPEYAEVNAQVL